MKARIIIISVIARSIISGSRVVPLLFALSLLLAARCSQAPESLENVVVDETFLALPLWEDGQAEVDFYKVTCRSCGIGEETLPETSFVLGAYLVRHEYSPERHSKAESGGGVDSFKWAMFYEYGSRYTYQAKFSYVANFLRRSVRPLKVSFTSFDWCSNVYSEMIVDPGGDARFAYRSDDYGNWDRSFRYRPNSFTMEQVPFLVRALDFGKGSSLEFFVVTPEGNYVKAKAELTGREAIAVAGIEEAQAAERIAVSYGDTGTDSGGLALTSPIGRVVQGEEIYWRGTDEAQTLLKVESSSFTMELIDSVRTSYWSHDKEDFFNMLMNVVDFP